MTIKDGGPAFPLATDGGHFCEGISTRDYFAAKAMQGMLACEMLRATEQEFSERAYTIADAMIRAREVTA